MVGRIIISLLMLALGASLVIKTEWYLQNLGTNAWAEEHLGTEGGSRLFYKLWGIGFIFFGFIFLFNMQQGLIMGTIGKLFVQ